MTPTLSPVHASQAPGHTPEPSWAEVLNVQKELADVATYALRFVDPAVQSAYRFRPGQFNMLYLPGFGEATISISSETHNLTSISHTVRFVGNVTGEISRLRAGDQVGMRGPFGSSWPLESLEGKDIFIACGGIGLQEVAQHLRIEVAGRYSVANTS